MNDYIVTAITSDMSVRAYALTASNMVETARKIHNTSPIVTAALGRILCGACVMGIMLKSDMESITIQIRGNGPIGNIVAVSDNNGNVRGYAGNPSVYLPLRPDNKLDVGTAVGKGTLTVIKDMGLKEPYIGCVPLVSGEIAEDITSYFAISEQTPTVCALGVLVDVDLSVKAAGGYIIQLMPDSQEGVIEKLESNIKDIQSVTDMLSEGMTPEDILRRVLRGFEVEVLDSKPVEYRCNCSRDRVRRALISLGKEEINSIIEQQGKAELICHFCEKKFNFSKEDLINLLSSANNKNAEE